jgi:hypothetical protein
MTNLRRALRQLWWPIWQAYGGRIVLGALALAALSIIVAWVVAL